MSDIVPRLLAASHDERLSTGALYREACQEITRLRSALWMVRPYVYGIERIREIDGVLRTTVQPTADRKADERLDVTTAQQSE